MGWRSRLVEHTLRDVGDVDGRPLGEVASPSYAQAERREVACPYSGARHGRVMNAAALRQVASVWPAVLRRLRAAGGEQATLAQVWRGLVGVMGEAARAEEPLGRELAATYKVSVGVLQVLTLLLLSQDGLADAPVSLLAGSEAVLAPSLVGSAQVCSGSPQQIEAALDALGTGELIEPTATHHESAMLVTAVLLLGVVSRQALLNGEAGDGAEPRELGLRWIHEHPAPWFRPVISGVCAPVERVLALAPAEGRQELAALAVALVEGTHRQRGERLESWLKARPSR